MKHVGRLLAALVRPPEMMDPDEIAERVEVLESKVAANRMALEEHERDRFAHGSEEKGRLEQ